MTATGRRLSAKRPWSSARARSRLGTALRYLGLTIAAVVIIFPVYLALITSILPANEAATLPPHLLTSHPTFENFRHVFRIVPMWRFLWNSLVVAGTITLAQLCTAALAAYAFAFLRFPFRTPLFVLFLATLMVPAEVTIVPNFQTMLRLHWINTYQGLVVPFAATAFGTSCCGSSSSRCRARSWTRHGWTAAATCACFAR